MCHLCRWSRNALPKLAHRYDSGALLRIAMTMKYDSRCNAQRASDLTVGGVFHPAKIAHVPGGSPFEAESAGPLKVTTASPILPTTLESIRLCNSLRKAQPAFVEVDTLCCPPSNLGRWQQTMNALARHDAPVIVVRLHEPRALGLCDQS